MHSILTLNIGNARKHKNYERTSFHQKCIFFGMEAKCVTNVHKAHTIHHLLFSLHSAIIIINKIVMFMNMFFLHDFSMLFPHFYFVLTFQNKKFSLFCFCCAKFIFMCNVYFRCWFFFCFFSSEWILYVNNA